MDVRLRRYPRDNYGIPGENSENEVDLRSNRQDQVINHENGEFRSYLNTDLSEKSGSL